jgi:oligosaccharide repeat unit polymerase
MRYFSIVDGRIPNEFQFQAMKYILLSLLFLHIGYVLVLSINNRENRTIRINNVNNTTKILALRKVALVIFFVTLIPMLLRMGHSISLASSYGHLVYRSLKANEEYLGGWFYISYITGWFIPACYMLLITATTNKQKNIGLVIIGIYCVLYLFTGSRYQLIEIVTSVLLIQIYWHKIELTSRTVFKYLIFSILILIVLKGVGYTRDLSTGTQLLTIDNVKTIFKSGLIYEVLSTTSTTFTTISNAIYHCPTTINYNCGLNLLGSIAYIFPRFLRPSWINMINVESVFSPLYYGWTISGYGSSFLAEAYYNYGYFSYIVMIVYGLVLAKICNMIRNSSQKMDPYRIYISIYLCSEIIWAIRSDLYLIPRHMVLYVIIPISFARLIEMKRNKI